MEADLDSLPKFLQKSSTIYHHRHTAADSRRPASNILPYTAQVEEERAHQKGDVPYTPSLHACAESSGSGQRSATAKFGG